MITSERQLRVSLDQIEELSRAHAELEKEASESNNPHLELEARSILFMIKDIKTQVLEYEDLKAGKIKDFRVTDFSELPYMLIKARIANGLSQSDLAEKLSMKVQQIQRYEAEEYGSLSLRKLLSFADALNIQIDGKAQLLQISDSEKYPVREMYKRGWFPDFHGNLKQALANADELISAFFELSNYNQSLALHKKTLRLGNDYNIFSLAAWEARVLQKAYETENPNKFKFKDLNDQWVNGLVKLSLQDNWARKVVSYLENVGIILVVEPHLEGTYLDGATIMLPDKRPVIALTLRHDRIDNFWFVLLHEIAHIVLHFQSGLYTEFFDDLDLDKDGLESEADQFALNALISDEVWRKSIARFTQTEAAVIAQAEKLQVHPALIAGRIRRETQKYHILTKLVGNGEVRKNFSDFIDEEI